MRCHILQIIISIFVIANFCWGYNQGPILGTRPLTGTDTVQVCTTVRAGSGTLVLVLREYRPSEYGAQELSITLPNGRKLIAGIYPDQAFNDISLHHRFRLMSLPQNINLDTPICVFVKLLLPDGFVRLSLELWPIRVKPWYK